MKNQTIFTKEFSAKFKRSYAYKMGGTQTITLPNGQSFTFNDKEYYCGRGAKYNSSIKHDEIGNINVSQEEVETVILNRISIAGSRKMNKLKSKEKTKRIEGAKSLGVYSMANESYGRYVELSDEESLSKTFDSKRLANTLSISIHDADLLKSEGKTYVFAKSSDGNTYQLYHPSLDCNHLSISVSVATPERIAEFKPKEWQSAPYAEIVGQTAHTNHFAC